MKKLLLIGLILAACQQDDQIESEPSLDYLIFGHFYGECIGERCVEMYKLTNQFLYEDFSDSYPGKSKPDLHNFLKLNNDLFEKVKPLRSKISQELLNTTAQIIGQPDNGDWGGIYFEISEGGENKYWFIDKMRSNLPSYLVPFVEEIERDIELIK